MRKLRANGRLAAVGSGLAVVALASIVALALTGVATALTPSLGVLADGTTTKAVKFDEGPLKMKTRGPIRVRYIHVGRTDGFNSGWHTHAGPEIIAVKEGMLTVTVARERRGDDDDDEDNEGGSAGGSCESTVLTAGQAFIAEPNVPFTITASGSIEFAVGLLLPVGAPLSTPVATPTC
jgi:hypothetical protein